MQSDITFLKSYIKLYLEDSEASEGHYMALVTIGFIPLSILIGILQGELLNAFGIYLVLIIIAGSLFKLNEFFIDKKNYNEIQNYLKKMYLDKQNVIELIDILHQEKLNKAENIVKKYFKSNY